KSSCPIARICTDCVLLAPCQTQPKSAQCEGHQKLPNCHKVRNRKQRCEIESYPPETLKFCGYLRMAYRAGGWHVWLIRRSCAEFSPSAQLSRPSRAPKTHKPLEGRCAPPQSAVLHFDAAAQFARRSCGRHRANIPEGEGLDAIKNCHIRLSGIGGCHAPGGEQACHGPVKGCQRTERRHRH